MRWLKIAVPLVALALAGCSSQPEQLPVLTRVKEIAKGLVRAKPDTTARKRLVESLSRKQLIGMGNVPLILVLIEANRNYATLTQISANGGYAVFVSGDNKTMTFRKGVLTATRGMGADLFALDATATLARLRLLKRGEVAQLQKRYRFLNAENGLDETRFDCTIGNRGVESVISVHKRFRLERFDERCSSPGKAAFVNTYWMDPKSRIIWRSRQWVAPKGGYVTIDVLVPEKSQPTGH